MGEEFIKQPIMGKHKQDGGHKPSRGEGSEQYLCAIGMVQLVVMEIDFKNMWLTCPNVSDYVELMYGHNDYE